MHFTAVFAIILLGYAIGPVDYYDAVHQNGTANEPIPMGNEFAPSEYVVGPQCLAVVNTCSNSTDEVHVPQFSVDAESGARNETASYRQYLELLFPSVKGNWTTIPTFEEVLMEMESMVSLGWEVLECETVLQQLCSVKHSALLFFVMAVTILIPGAKRIVSFLGHKSIDSVIALYEWAFPDKTPEEEVPQSARYTGRVRRLCERTTQAQACHSNTRQGTRVAISSSSSAVAEVQKVLEKTNAQLEKVDRQHTELLLSHELLVQELANQRQLLEQVLEENKRLQLRSCANEPKGEPVYCPGCNCIQEQGVVIPTDATQCGNSVEPSQIATAQVTAQDAIPVESVVPNNGVDAVGIIEPSEAPKILPSVEVVKATPPEEPKTTTPDSDSVESDDSTPLPEPLQNTQDTTVLEKPDAAKVTTSEVKPTSGHDVKATEEYISVPNSTQKSVVGENNQDFQITECNIDPENDQTQVKKKRRRKRKKKPRKAEEDSSWQLVRSKKSLQKEHKVSSQEKTEKLPEKSRAVSRPSKRVDRNSQNMRKSIVAKRPGKDANSPDLKKGAVTKRSGKNTYVQAKDRAEIKPPRQCNSGRSNQYKNNSNQHQFKSTNNQKPQNRSRLQPVRTFRAAAEFPWCREDMKVKKQYTNKNYEAEYPRLPVIERKDSEASSSVERETKIAGQKKRRAKSAKKSVLVTTGYPANQLKKGKKSAMESKCSTVQTTKLHSGAGERIQSGSKNSVKNSVKNNNTKARSRQGQPVNSGHIEGQSRNHSLKVPSSQKKSRKSISETEVAKRTNKFRTQIRKN